MQSAEGAYLLFSAFSHFIGQEFNVCTDDHLYIGAH
jgi:hypothetical protein